MRTFAAVVIVLAACSGGDDASGPTTAPGDPLVSTGVPVVGAPSTVVAGGEPEAQSIDRDVVVAADAHVAITVESPFGDTSFSGRIADSLDPFGEFVSCSGVRSAFATYSILGSALDGAVRSVSVVTSEPVAAPGIHAATVRIELASGAPYVANGSMTIDEGFSRGEFTAIDIDGERIDGRFDCTGGPGAQPVAVGADDGVLDLVEVVALLRNGDAERLVDLVARPAAGASVECAGAVGGESPTVVRVDGDAAVGTVSTFELTSGDASTMRIRVGEASYQFVVVDASPENTPSSGVFNAEADDITVDGAYRCS